MYRNPGLPSSDPSQPQGVSAVKALTIAATQGQRIYTLNLRNQALHTSILQSLQISQDIKSEILDALSAGREVLVHEKEISVENWTGTGYIILDPNTAAGAYKIGGGANGGELASDKISGLAFNMLGLDQISKTVTTLAPAMTRTINAVTFTETWLEGIIDCYRSEIVSAFSIIALAVVVGLIVGALTAGTGTVPATLVVLAVIAPTASEAAQSKECKLECSKATKSQLVNAIPVPILDAEQFKIDEGFGPPTSPYDICACKDGSLVIYGVSQCGRIKAGVDFHITDRRWK
jgi:hypothetical protein